MNLSKALLPITLIISGCSPSEQKMSNFVESSDSQNKVTKMDFEQCLQIQNALNDELVSSSNYKVSNIVSIKNASIKKYCDIKSGETMAVTCLREEKELIQTIISSKKSCI